MIPTRKCCGKPSWNHPKKSCNGRNVMVHEKELLALRELAVEAEQFAIGVNTGPYELQRLDREALERLRIKLSAWREARPALKDTGT